MPYEIKILDILDIELESSFLVLARNMGQVTTVKTWSYLILGGDDPILVDTGAASTAIMERLGMKGIQTEEMILENQLAAHGVKMTDVRWILHTHHHIDHAGQDDRFPQATVITNRRELEYSASGIMGGQYPPEYVKHHIDRLHTPGALRLLELARVIFDDHAGALRHPLNLDRPWCRAVGLVELDLDCAPGLGRQRQRQTDHRSSRLF